MRIETIKTGSKGNFYLLHGIAETLLIEAGIKINEVLKALNFSFDNISYCLVSHSHKDHSLVANQLGKYGIKLIASEETLNSLKMQNQILIRPKQIFETKEFKIKAFETQHDCLGSLGFMIESKIEKKRIIFATDTYYLKYKFKDIDLFMIECNYDLETLTKNLDSNKVNKALFNRVRASHFELSNMIKYLKGLDIENLLIMPIHQSASNLDWELMKTEINKIGTFIGGDYVL